MARQKQEDAKCAVLLKSKDPFADSDNLTQFTNEVDNFSKFVESLERKNLNGTLPLDSKWKEILDGQVSGAQLFQNIVPSYFIGYKLHVLIFDFLSPKGE